MQYSLHIPFVGNVDMLREAVESVRSVFTGHIHIWCDGVSAPEIAGVECHTLPPNGAAATINMALKHSIDANDDLIFLMHADVLAMPGACDQFLAFAKARVERGDKWGVIFTLYDTFCAFNPKAVREVGYWDVRLYQYGTDNDYWQRLKLAGWSIIESAPIGGITRIPDKYVPYAEFNESVGIVHRGSATVRLDPLFKYITDGRNPGNSDYYILKWGGLPGQEKFTRPFEGFYKNGSRA